MRQKKKSSRIGNTAILLCGNDSNVIYGSGFVAPDPFIFFQIGRKKFIVASDLEIGRARSEAKSANVLSLTEITTSLKKKGVKQPSTADIISQLLRGYKVTGVIVPANFYIELADGIRKNGFNLTFKREPFFENRAIKTRDEIKKMSQVQRFTEEAVWAAVKVLRASKIKGNKLYYDGEPLTSEYIRKVINVKLMEHNCVGVGTIVACGDQGCDPHCQGSGLLRPHQSIIMDVFPRSTDTMYCADMTRTVVKGNASKELKNLYNAVYRAQEHGFELIRDGADGSEIHREVEKVFEQHGYKTGQRNGKMEGFFHGTGHGIGLDIHEYPRIGKIGNILKKGYVVTNEPGLYYLGIGGVRIEDMVVVEKSGCRNLTKFPRFLEIE